VPAPGWWWRFLYDRESAAWERRRDEPAHRALVEQVVDDLAAVVSVPGPVADLGCGPGAHAIALARRGYEVVGLDGSPGMVAVASARAEREQVEGVRFAVHDVGRRLPFEDGSLGGVLAVLVLQHLRHPEAFVAETRRCLRPGGHLLLTAPARSMSTVAQPWYWQLRAAVAHRVPGVIRFDDADGLRELIERERMTVVSATTEPGRVTVLARAGA
jgi:SAM-dependent methyltransferase